MALGQAAAQTSTPASAPLARAAAPGRNGAAVARAPLDLHAPPLSHIYPSSELRYILAVDASNPDDTTEVSVKGSRYVVQVPGVPGNQLQAIPWALLHPTQAWRIFTPLEAP